MRQRLRSQRSRRVSPRVHRVKLQSCHLDLTDHPPHVMELPFVTPSTSACVGCSHRRAAHGGSMCAQNATVPTLTQRARTRISSSS
eukprot:6478172-Amphidinium_carterae.1